MSFYASIIGHMEGTPEEAKKLEEEFTSDLQAVVARFKDHIHDADMGGQHVLKDLKKAVVDAEDAKTAKTTYTDGETSADPGATASAS
jgi:hypothetical protein